MKKVIHFTNNLVFNSENAKGYMMIPFQSFSQDNRLNTMQLKV